MTNYFLTLTDDNLIRIRFQYNQEAVEKVKSFSVRNWNSENTCWEIPLNICYEIPQILGVQIPQDIKERYEYIYVPKPVKYNPNLLRPEIKPYNFQISGIEFLASNKNSLLSDEVGLGKTLQAIATALHLNCKKVLVVCPASVKRQWYREIQKFTYEKCVVIEGTQKQREQQYAQDVTFYILNYELVMRDLIILNKRVWDMVIADEVSRIKNWKSKTKAALIKIRTNFRLGLSATPIENNIQELHSIFTWINPNTLSTYWNFINEYCYFCSSKYGGYQITGIKDSKKLHDILKSVMIRRKKAEVFIELPEIIHNEYYVPLTSTQQKMYEEINNNIMNLVQKDEFGDNILNQIMYLRELCNSPRLLNSDLKENGKVDEIIEIIEQIIN
jgi:SNF2 family DNA or RNA helicase